MSRLGGRWRGLGLACRVSELVKPNWKSDYLCECSYPEPNLKDLILFGKTPTARTLSWGEMHISHAAERFCSMKHNVQNRLHHL